jgi:putative peptide zinc metalloprotease protein
MYSSDTRVAVRPYRYQLEASDVVIGFPDSQAFLVLQPDAFEILEQLSTGHTLGEVRAAYEKAHGETPDLEDFVTELSRRNLLMPLSGGAAAELDKALSPAFPPERGPRHHFTDFPVPLARLLFGRISVILQLSLIASAVVTACLAPRMLPSRTELFFPDHLALTTVLILLFSLVTAAIHEVAHLVAARAVGVSARIGLSHRLWIVMLETDLTGLWAVPRRQRYLPLLAGPLIDASSASLLVLLVSANDYFGLAFPPQGIQCFKAMTLIYLLRLFWQCYFFLRTDFYYILTLTLDCKNLMQDTETFLRNQLSRVSRRWRTVDQSHIPQAELRFVRWYSVPWVLGRALAFYVLVAIQIPNLWIYAAASVAKLQTGYKHDLYAFIDSLTLTLVGTAILATGLYLWIRGLLRNRRNDYAAAH